MRDTQFIAILNKATTVMYQNGCYVAKLPEMCGKWLWVFVRMDGPYREGEPEILFIDMNRRPMSFLFKPYTPEFRPVFHSLDILESDYLEANKGE